MLTVSVYIPGVDKSKAAGGPVKSSGYVSVSVPPEAFIWFPAGTVALNAAVGLGPLTKILTLAPAILWISV
jgi:hypothetical protein